MPMPRRMRSGSDAAGDLPAFRASSLLGALLDLPDFSVPLDELYINSAAQRSRQCELMSAFADVLVAHLSLTAP